MPKFKVFLSILMQSMSNKNEFVFIKKSCKYLDFLAFLKKYRFIYNYRIVNNKFQVFLRYDSNGVPIINKIKLFHKDQFFSKRKKRFLKKRIDGFFFLTTGYDGLNLSPSYKGGRLLGIVVF